MNQRIVDQLATLERGARVDAPPARFAYDNSSAEYSAYDLSERVYDASTQYTRNEEPGGPEFADQPMVLDSFDEQLLRQPDYNSRQGQAALGRARLSLAPENTYVDPHDSHYDTAMPPMHRYQPEPPGLNLSRFAFDSNHQGAWSSSPNQQQLPSSPAFKASQLRAPPVEYSRPTLPDFRGYHNPPHLPHAEYQDSDMHRRDIEPDDVQSFHREPYERFDVEPGQTNATARRRVTSGGPPPVQGIDLVTTQTLPDRFRAIFPYPLFNAVQSKCFDTIYKTNDNLVLSAPTGSGKTAILELAVCRVINGFANGSFKIVYQAPTKSLCAARQRDWQAKFAPLDLQCAELTGDTDHAQLRNVQHASIIITTPEKWDSMTRRWKDHQKLMQMVKLFLIDEVHILKEDRSATLEAVVSRMKSIGSNVRFVALSATVPNSQDIAVWLGKDYNTPEVPAVRERFGEEFRPVRLQKHVCGWQSGSNDFGFEKTLNAKLPDIIAKYSQRKPLMVFCFTRNACTETAKLLASWWNTKGPRERYWESPRKHITAIDKDLQETISSGVAFHHAGLDLRDRNAIEKGYVEGDINVICCTSTLAVGINLPCHMVIIKNTITYQNAAMGGCKEYSDLEIMQMLGRAGRPQFDNSAIAVIMTRLQRVQHYEKMISGQEILESCLHRNLIDHLNAEIGLGTIHSVTSAKRWLMGTFLYVRLKENPEHYKIEGDVPGKTLDERLGNICEKGIAALEDYDLITKSHKLQCTEYGDAMARYYLQFDTMKIFLDTSEKAKVSEILSRLAQAAEFKDIRFRAGEKRPYSDLNKNPSIKFPIAVNLDAPAHKTTLVIQSVLGVLELPTEDHKHRLEYNAAKTIIFQHVHRLIRCIVDCQLYRQDAVTTRNALMLARSLGAQVWDDSPLHMKQLEGVGPMAVRKLVAAEIKSLDDLENVEAHRLESVLSRNPPYGAQLQEKARAFPKLRVSISMVGEPAIKKGESVKVNLRAEIGFLNEKVPEVFQRKPVYVCLVAEDSDGKLLHFARISAKKLNKGQDVPFSAELTSATQSVRAYVMCDEIAGTLRYVNLKPGISAGAFPQKSVENAIPQAQSTAYAPNIAKRRVSSKKNKAAFDDKSDDFGDEDIDDADLAQAEFDGFVDIDEFDEVIKQNQQSNQKKRKRTSAAEANAQNTTESYETWEPQQLANGNWACNHACKDKTKCKHMCCRDGLDKKPKPPKSSKPKESKKETQPGSDPKQTQLNLPSKKPSIQAQQLRTMKNAPASAPHRPATSQEVSDLNRLHNSIKTKTPHIPMVGHRSSEGGATPAYHKRGQSNFSFLPAGAEAEKEDTSDYGDDFFDSNELPSMSALVDNRRASRGDQPSGAYDDGIIDNEVLDDMDDDIWNDDFSQGFGEGQGDGHVDLSSYADDTHIFDDDAFAMDDPRNDNFKAPMAPMSRPPETKQNEFSQITKDLFVGESSDSATQDLGLSERVPGKMRANCSDFAGPAKRRKTTSRTPSAQLREETENAAPSLPEGNFLSRVAEQVSTGPSDKPEEEEASKDKELRELFEREFGTELFNLTGF